MGVPSSKLLISLMQARHFQFFNIWLIWYGPWYYHMLPQNRPEMHFCLSGRFSKQHRIFRHIWNPLVRNIKHLNKVNRILFLSYDGYTFYRIWYRYIHILNLPVEVFLFGISTGFITSTQVIFYIITHHKVESILSSSGSKWGHIYKFKQS